MTKEDVASEDEGLSPEEQVQRLNAKHRMLRRICVCYVGVIGIILFVAVLRCCFPAIERAVLRDEVGVVAFVCFVSIQAIFEVETEESVRRHPQQFYAKIAVYVADACILVNARVKASVTIFGCLFALLQLAYLYYELVRAFLALTHGSKTKAKKGGSLVGTLTITINMVALLMMMGKDVLFRVNIDVLKSIIAAGVVMLYFNVVVHAKTQEFMGGKAISPDASVVFNAFRIIRPVGSAILTKLKKLKKVKAKF